MQTGVFILRYKDAAALPLGEAKLLAHRGACPPNLRRDEYSDQRGSDGGGGNGSGSGGSGGGGSGGESGTCTDARLGRAHGLPDVLAALSPRGTPCACGAPAPGVLAELEAALASAEAGAAAAPGGGLGGGGAGGAGAGGLVGEFEAHCRELGRVEAKGCGFSGKHAAG